MSVEAMKTCNKERPKSSLYRLLTTIGVWYLYVPYRSLLCLVGPRVAVRIGRLTAWIHWLMTFFGAQRAALLAIRRTLPELETDLSPRAILRKYLENKHHHFVVWNLATTQRGRDFIEQTCTAFEGREEAEATRAVSNGMILLVYHYGTCRVVSLSLKRRYGAEVFEIAYMADTYGRDTLPWVARLASQKMLEADQKVGLDTVEITPNTRPLSVIRHLRKGKMVGIAGDGFVAQDFVEVPFLGGTMRFPAGFARLAAMTGATVLPMFGLMDGLEAHRVIAHSGIRCEDGSRESVEAAVAACAKILEDYVRRYPWAWWIWHRLEFDQHEDGRMRITAHAVAAAD